MKKLLALALLFAASSLYAECTFTPAYGIRCGQPALPAALVTIPGCNAALPPGALCVWPGDGVPVALTTPAAGVPPTLTAFVFYPPPPTSGTFEALEAFLEIDFSMPSQGLVKYDGGRVIVTQAQ